MQALIPGLVEKLKTGEVLSDPFQEKETPAQKVTLRGILVSSNLTPLVTTSSFSGTVHSNADSIILGEIAPKWGITRLITWKAGQLENL